MSTVNDDWGGDFSVIKDKGEISYIDYEDDKSVCSYNPVEEGPITISVPFAFVNDKPRSVIVGETSTDAITLKNTTDESVDLWAVKIYASNPENSFTISLMEPPSENANIEDVQAFLECFSLENRMIHPDDTLTIWLSCKPKEIGLHTTVVQFDVGDDRIERVCFLLADDKISQPLASRKPYSRDRRKRHEVVEEYIPGSRPARTQGQGFKNFLPRYDIPKHIRDELSQKETPTAIREGLKRDTYVFYFMTLLNMEELQLEEDMRAYDMERVTMRRKGHQFLSLEVPGLAEKRPSLVHGDYILAKMPFSNASVSAYQGYIHHVEADQVYLKFAPEFHITHRDDILYNVQFTFNRINMRRFYQAIDAAESLAKEFLFPYEFSEKRYIKTNPLVSITQNVNEEQLRCVQMILGCKGAPPYLVHGPPGTGKTQTLVEAILQLYTTRKNARILVCAPSNSAADHILEKLLSEESVEIRDNDVFRLNASSRQYNDVNPDHIRYCFFDEQIFRCPPRNALVRYRIVVSTYTSTSLLYAEDIKRGHFSHIFLDEAGQASEPETIIPISNLCLRKTVVVLAGDPMQLGPVIYSKEAEIFGLGKSYLERLFDCKFYHPDTGDENYVIKLVRNYRCHPDILHLPSTLFYRGELIACKDENSFLTDTADILEVLPSKEYPVLFFGIQGCDEREGNNPSWFNRIEVSKVVETVKKLTAGGNLREENIGVITPYRQQVLKIRKALDSLDMIDIKVGSVEQFQGQERQVIIVSTVRSTIKHNESDRTYCLGFLSNPKRFNVAVTRAMSLLVIIGNPHIIYQDMYWSKLLWQCVDKDSYKGCPLPERQDPTDEQHQCNNEELQSSGFEVAAVQSSGFEVAAVQSSGFEVAAADQNREEPPQQPPELEFSKPFIDEADWEDGWK